MPREVKCWWGSGLKLAFNQNTEMLQFVFRNILWGTLLLRLEEATVFSSSNFLKLKKKKKRENLSLQAKGKPFSMIFSKAGIREVIGR